MIVDDPNEIVSTTLTSMLSAYGAGVNEVAGIEAYKRFNQWLTL